MAKDNLNPCAGQRLCPGHNTYPWMRDDWALNRCLLRWKTMLWRWLL